MDAIITIRTLLAFLALATTTTSLARDLDVYVEYDEIRQDNRGRGNVNELNMGVVVEDDDSHGHTGRMPELERLLRDLPEGGNINIRRIGGHPAVRE